MSGPTPISRKASRGSEISLVIGIDPGSRITGYGLVESGPDGSLVCRLAGEIRPSPGWPLERRLGVVFDGLTEIIAEHNPEEMAVEDIYFSRNARAALALGQARGAALIAAARHGIPVRTYTASEIKKAVVGYGRAGKEQVGQMVRSLLAINQPLGADVTDALACAICHLNTSRTLGRLAGGAVQ